MSFPNAPDFGAQGTSLKERPLHERLPNTSIQNVLQKYTVLGATSTATNAKNLESTGAKEDIALTEDQWQALLRDHASRMQDMDPEYKSQVDALLKTKRKRVALMKETLKLERPAPRGAQNVKPNLSKELSNILIWHTKRIINHAGRERGSDGKIYSHEVLLLRSQIRALEESVQGKSYIANGGIAKLPERSLNFAVAADHLERHIDSLIKTRRKFQQAVRELEDDVKFNRKLVAELSTITELTGKRERQLVEGSETRLTYEWISAAIETRKGLADAETKQLMGFLRYTIKQHLSSHIALKAHTFPAIASLDQSKALTQNPFAPPSEPHHQKPKFAEVTLSVTEAASKEDVDISDNRQIAQRLQIVLLSLLNNLAQSTPDEMQCTELNSSTDLIVRFLLAAEVAVQPEGSPHLIHLRDYAAS